MKFLMPAEPFLHNGSPKSTIKIIRALPAAGLYAYTTQALATACAQGRRTGRYPLQSITLVWSLVISHWYF
jgi:hypothetical protein